MLYRWDKFSLDSKRSTLELDGRKINASRRVLACIAYLAERHNRVVGYDELILAMWGRTDLTNHQLSHLILSARRAIQDDGQHQRYIRTILGVGYRWVAPLTISDSDITLHLPNPANDVSKVPKEPGASKPNDKKVDAVDPHAIDMPGVNLHAIAPNCDEQASIASDRIAKCSFRLVASVSLILFVLAVGPASTERFRINDGTSLHSASDAAKKNARDPISALRSALFMGRYEEVREGLATLPPDLSESLEARTIEIELDLRRGRFSQAADRIEAQRKHVDASGNPTSKARLLLLQSELNNRLQLSGEEILAPAQAAVDLLESNDAQVPREALASALWHRAYGYILTDRFAEARRDLIRARDIYQEAGDLHRSAEVRASLARISMRNGNMSIALDEMRSVADDFALFKDATREIFARNTMTKIQIEMLRWDDALKSNDRSMALLKSIPESERRYPTVQLRAMALTGQGRLREAASLLEYTETSRSERRDHIIPSIHFLEAGNPKAALEAAMREFTSTRIDTPSNLLLENKDGALLLWVMSAQALASEGSPLPFPSKEQSLILENPQTTTARAARGRWLLATGKLAEAEVESRRAFEEFDRKGQLYRMTLAAEPLIDVLIARGDLESARDVLIALRARDPEHTDRDYRVSLMRLKLALAEGDEAAIAIAYRSSVAVGRERPIPDALHQNRN